MSWHIASTRGVLVAVGGAAVAGAIAIAAPAFAATVDVAVGNYYFEDSSVGDGQVTARVGDQLRFSFVEGAGHTATIAALGIDSGQLPSGATYVTPALTTPGTYSLICTTHRARNHATTLVVLAGGGTTTTNPPPSTSPSTTTSTPTSAPSTPPSTSPGGAGGTGSGSGAVPGDTAGVGIGIGIGGDDDDQDTGAADGDGLLPAGVSGDDGTPWLRAVWVALGTLPFFAAAVALTEWSARRRPQSGATPADD